jgi:type I restriction enzyme S subunit
VNNINLKDEPLPHNWEKSSIGAIAKYDNGRAFKPAEWESSGLPIVRIQNLNDPNANFNYSSRNYEDKYMIKNGDLLFAWSASLGAYIWHGQDAWLNQHTFKVTPYEGINKLFLFYLLKYTTTELYSKTHGSGMVHFTKKKFENTDITIPPTNEQKRIVAKIEELFSDLDKGVENLKTAREQLKVYRQSVLKHAFEGKLTAKWREQNKDKLQSADELMVSIKKARKSQYEKQIAEWKDKTTSWESDGKKGKRPTKPKPLKKRNSLTSKELALLPNLPTEWSWDKLGFMTCSPEYGTSEKSAKTGLMPVLRMGNILNSKFDWNDLVYSSNHEDITKYQLSCGDVLFNRTNSPELVGKTAIYKDERPALFAGYLIRVNHIDSIVKSDYLNQFLNSHIAIQHGNSVKTDGVNQSNINGEKLQEYPFPYCSIDEQEEVVRILDEKLAKIDVMEDGLNFELNKAEVLRQSILKKAFSGQLVEQDPNDEPASALLKRIKTEKEKHSKPKKKRKKS